MTRALRLFVLSLACMTLPLATAGCGSTVADWIVRTRNHQGDIALEHKNFSDASVAYELALQIDPTNVHGTDGSGERADTARRRIVRSLEVRRRDRCAGKGLESTRRTMIAWRACAPSSSSRDQARHRGVELPALQSDRPRPAPGLRPARGPRTPRSSRRSRSSTIPTTPPISATRSSRVTRSTKKSHA